ncbi:hypothetical protein F8M41_010172 [Gigaspora margarita]|uniref:Uncharacterized protein n=1 Tax=Gigaspora margarita TaxID=4874 RepID=A0A8H4AUQ6_GIGMA|nr:hypothetical protein F8M41_010172 [Gigaspora margarita]
MQSESSDIKSKDFDRINKGVRNKNEDSKSGKGKSRADKLPKLPVEDFNILNKNKKSYFYVGKDKERDEETTQLRQASN